MKARHGDARERAELIAEMMLAKSVLEEKNEILDQKDRRIRYLTSRVRQLEGELAEERRTGGCLADGGTEVCLEGLMGDVVDCLERSRANGEDSELSTCLLDLFGRKYGLRRIETVGERIDPDLHRVVDSVGEGVHSLEVVSPGYRLGDHVLRPVSVRAVGAETTTLHSTS